ncbi:MAG: hypothetical protein ABFC84_13375 [Veillonellales bacterium]
MFKEASLKAQKKQGDLLLDKSTIVPIGKYTYKIRYMRTYTNALISSLMVDVKIATSDIPRTIGLMKEGTRLHARIAAYGLLCTWLKIKLFHWVYWRIIWIRHDEQEINQLMSAVIEKMGVGFFFLTTETTENLNSLMRKMTKTEAQSLSLPEQK